MEEYGDEQLDVIDDDFEGDVYKPENEGPTFSKELSEILEADNVASILSEGVINKASSDLQEMINEDLESMKPWQKKYKKALILSKMEDEPGDKTFPFVGASKVMMPFIMEAALDFNSRVVPDILGRKDVVQVATYGKADEESTARAGRVSEYENYQVTKGIKGWQDAQDKAFMLLPIVGTYYKKNWWDPDTGKQEACLIHPDKLITDHTATVFSDLRRETFEYDMNVNDVVSAINTGRFIDCEIEDEDKTHPITFQECHCWYDLDEDGYQEPYIVTIRKSTDKVVSIVKRFHDADIKTNEKGDIYDIVEEKFFSCTIFISDPGETYMGLGYGILLSDLYDTLNTNFRQMLDAGTLQITGANSGFISSDLSPQRNVSRQQKGKIDMVMGQFTTVQGTNLRDGIMNFPFAGATPTQMQLTEFLSSYVREFTMKTNIDGQPGEAAEMYLARLSQAMKMPTSIMGRVYRGLSTEFERIYQLAFLYESDERYQDILNDGTGAIKEDFKSDSYDICPTANPALGSEQEQIQRATIMKNDALTYPVPGVYNVRQTLEDYYTALGYDKTRIESILPPPQPSQPDPIMMAQVQAQQTIAQAEQMKGEADMMAAQAKIMQAQIDMEKLGAELDKLESETIKNYADADKKSADTAQSQIRQQFDEFKMVMEEKRNQIDQQHKEFELKKGARQEHERINQPKPS